MGTEILSIRTNTGNMQETVSQLKQNVTTMQDRFIDMQKAYNLLKSYWEGEAREQFCTVYDKDALNVVSFICEAENYVNNMKATATQYSTTEGKIIGQMPTR